MITGIYEVVAFVVRAAFALALLFVGLGSAWGLARKRPEAPERRRAVPGRTGRAALASMLRGCAASSVYRSMTADRLRVLARDILSVERGLPEHDTYGVLRDPAESGLYGKDGMRLLLEDHLMANAREKRKETADEPDFSERVGRLVGAMGNRLHGKDVAE